MLDEWLCGCFYAKSRTPLPILKVEYRKSMGKYMVCNNYGCGSPTSEQDNGVYDSSRILSAMYILASKPELLA